MHSDDFKGKISVEIRMVKESNEGGKTWMMEVKGE